MNEAQQSLRARDDDSVTADEAHSRFVGGASARDALAALPARPLFDRRLAMSLARAIERRRPLAVLMIDLAPMCRDTNGIETTELLALFAKRISPLFRAHGLLYYMRPTAFTCVFEDVPGEQELVERIRRLQKTLSTPLRVGSSSIAVRFGIGYAVCPQDGLLGDDLCRRALIASKSAISSGADIASFGYLDD